MVTITSPKDFAYASYIADHKACVPDLNPLKRPLEAGVYGCSWPDYPHPPYQTFTLHYARRSGESDSRHLQAKEWPTAIHLKGVAEVRKWKDAFIRSSRSLTWTSPPTLQIYKKTLRSKDEARTAIETAVNKPVRSSLKSLFMHGWLNLPSDEGRSLSEADQTPTFVLPILFCIVNRQGHLRGAKVLQGATPTAG
ncbi:hypothetical protein B0O80DRAFT_423803 [Mortierella sp. GBAus27b]|nr:hypothetical protein B0O80DRAFT_423803 [Mortierella sp. GBAus27b]